MKIKTATFKILFALSLMILFSCTGNGVKEPEQIGKKVFTILKDLSTKSNSDYFDNFISFEELKEMWMDEKVVTDEETRSLVSSSSKEEVAKGYIDSIKKSFFHLKMDGGKFGINWQEIEYLDSVYSTYTRSGIKKCEGYLFFKHNDQSYKVHFMTLFDGTEYKLAFIEDLEKS